MLLLAPLALAADLPYFEYTRPEEGGTAADVGFTRWEPGQMAYAAEVVEVTGVVGTPGVRVAAGQALTVVRVGAVASVGGYVNAWYEVQAGPLRGWVFGAGLTPFAWAADFDGDTVVDTLSVSFTADHQIRVWLGERTLVLPTAGGVYLGQRGAGVQADLVPAAKAGAPLLHLYTGVESCADYADYWVSLGRSGPVVARQESGLADPPSCFGYEPVFSPGALTVTYTGNGCAEDESAPEVSTKRFLLVDGVYLEEATPAR